MVVTPETLGVRTYRGHIILDGIVQVLGLAKVTHYRHITYVYM
jgi:hypothetical protein